MERWIGKVAVVTGASVGIGAAIADALTRSGLKVVGLARRMEKLQQVADNLKNTPGKFYPFQCDLRNEKNIVDAFKYADQLGGCDVLVNNAGLLVSGPIAEGSAESFHKVMDVNVIAMAICTREALRSLKHRAAHGHIININSVAGHNAGAIKYPIGLYTASKYAVTGMTSSLRHEIEAGKLNVKLSSVSPGAVDTDMIAQAVLDFQLLENIPKLKDKDIKDAVMYVLGTPPHVQVDEMIITPKR